jgi:hypothetical protein
MPIDVKIDPELRLVVATPQGMLTHEEMVSYQRQVWSDPEMAGYQELVDMSQVDRLAFESPARVKELAALSAGMDDPKASTRMAIVASDDLYFALGRMYQAYRELNPSSTRKVEVFRNREAALRWLGISVEPPEA